VTIGQLLHDAAQRLHESGSETPRLDAEVLLSHALGVDRATILAAPEAGVGDDARNAYAAMIERRLTGEPVSYIRGMKEFYGIALAVDRRALIPRPETEQIVDLALSRIATALTAAPRPPGTPPLEVIDVGTGSGAIAVALAVEARRRGYAAELHIVATDVSAEALSLALENAVVHGVADAVEIAHTELAAGLAPADLLVANLPYVPSAVVPSLPVAASFEPAMALDGGADGLDVVRALVETLPEALNPTGVALLEIGANQADAVRAIVADRLPAWHLSVHDDLAGRARVAEIRRLT
jgi:release factor glutamine methyltransferase